MLGRWYLYQKITYWYASKWDKKILCCAHIRHICGPGRNFTILAENRLFSPAKWGSLKNCVCINVAPKNVLRTNFMDKSKKFLYQKFWETLARKIFFEFLLGRGGRDKSPKIAYFSQYEWPPWRNFSGKPIFHLGK